MSRITGGSERRGTRRRAVPIAVLMAIGGIAAWPAGPAYAGPQTLGINVPAVAIDPVTGTVWAAVQTGASADSVVKVSETDQSVLDTYSVPAGVAAIAVDSVAGDVWAASAGLGPGSAQSVTQITESGGTTTTVDLSKDSGGSEITGIAADQHAGKVFVLMANGTLVAITETAPAAPAVIATGTAVTGSAVAVDGGRIWVADSAHHTVSAFTEDGAPVAGLADIGVGTNPVALAADPATRTLWVASQGSSSVTEIDDATGQVLAHAIGVGTNPVAITADPAAKSVWVASLAPDLTLAKISEAVTPGRLVGLDAGSFAGVQTLTSVATDPASGQAYLAGSGFGAGVLYFLDRQPPSSIQPSAWFASNDTTRDSLAVGGMAFPPPVFSMTGAPRWLHLNRATGVLSGVPPASSKVLSFPNIVITAANPVAAVRQPFTMRVGTDPVITSPVQVTFAAGVPGSFQVTAKALPKASFSLAFGTGLPKGLSFTAAGKLSGTPATGTIGRYIYGLVASNPVDPTGVGEVFTLDVVRGHRPAFTSPSKVTFRHGRRASFTVRTSGLPVPRLKVGGILPAGLRIKLAANGTALIYGTPRLPRRTDTIRITASNGIGRPVTQALTITIS